MTNTISKKINRAFAIIIGLVIIMGCFFATPINAFVSQTSTISTYTCDFESKYYSTSSVNCTDGSIETDGDNSYLSFNATSNGEQNYFEIYNSSSGVLTLNDKSKYLVSLKYKVDSVAVANDTTSPTYINIARYDGQNKQIVRIKAFSNTTCQPGFTSDWLTCSVLFDANIASSAQYNRLAINVVSPTASSSNPTVICFDDIVVTECASTTNAIDFITNGGSSCETLMAQPGEAITLPTPTKKYYDFLGWYSDSNLTNSVSISTMPNAKSTTLYAKWGISSTSVKIEYDTKKGSPIDMSVATPGEDLTLPVPTRYGFHFAGWYNADYTQKFTSNVFPNENTVLYAKWEVIPRFCGFDNTDAFVKEPENGKFTKRGKLSKDAAHSGTTGLYYDYTTGTSVGASAWATVMLIDEYGQQIALDTDRTYHISFKYKVIKVTAGQDRTCSFGLVMSAAVSAWTDRLEQDDAIGDGIKYSSADIGKGWLTGTFVFKPSASVPTANYIGIGIGGDSIVYVDDILVYEVDSEFPYKGNLVVFDSMGGSYCESINGNVGDPITLPESPVREGYNFLGWYADKNCDSPYDETTFNKAYTVVYADWSKIQEPTVDTPVIDETPSVTKDDSNNSTLIIIIVAAAVIVLGVLVTVIIIKKKSKNKSKTDSTETNE